MLLSALKTEGKAAAGAADALAPEKQALFDALQASPQTLDSFARLGWSQDLLEWLTRAHGKLGDPLLQAVKTAVDTAPPGVAERLVRVAGTLSDDVVAVIKQVGDYSETLADLAKVVDKVPSHERVARLVNNVAAHHSKLLRSRTPLVPGQ